MSYEELNNSTIIIYNKKRRKLQRYNEDIIVKILLKHNKVGKPYIDVSMRKPREKFIQCVSFRPETFYLVPKNLLNDLNDSELELLLNIKNF